MPPVISVITPTYRRACVLLGRCLPSVCAQTFRDIEHIVVSDGPDPQLAARIAALNLKMPYLRYAETLARGGHWGHEARLLGLAMARGEWIAWLDDDDAWRPDHLQVMRDACVRSEAAWGYSRMLIGADNWDSQRYRDDPGECSGDEVFDPARGGVLSSMIFSRREAFETATWQTGTMHPDGDLVRAWHEAGLPYVSVPQVTADMHIHRPDCPAGRCEG